MSSKAKPLSSIFGSSCRAASRSKMSCPWKLNSPHTLLVLDWDGTVAAHDTLALIAPSPQALMPYTEAYMADYKALSDRLGERNTLDKMFQWLDAMEEVEYTSVKRVEDGMLFKSMPRSEMLDRARDTTKLDLQEGIVDLLKDFKGTWGIVSVGWSGAFIRAAMESRGIDVSSKNVKIRANEVEFDESGLGTGKITKHKENKEGIRVARDKKREMYRMVEEWRNTVTGGAVIYVGDSETDLMCLLDADIGIIMNSPSMVDKCRKLGLTVRDAADIPESLNDTSKTILYHASSFRALL